MEVHFFPFSVIIKMIREKKNRKFGGEKENTTRQALEN
jgi:hypothetical protein